MVTVNIKKQTNSSITKNLSFDLDDYTIFAGENNSGKSNLIRAIKATQDSNGLKDYKIIYISAENTQPQKEELKSSASSTEFYKLLEDILQPIFDKKLINSLIKKFDKARERKKFVKTVNKFLKDFGVSDKSFDVKIEGQKFSEDLIVKIVKAFVNDLYNSLITEVDLNNIGMGTQRLIVMALIKYYQEKKIEADEKVLIIFEEPEIYLHPKYKESLYRCLVKLSKRKNTMVLITTHDPYFIELGEKQKIYKIYRSDVLTDQHATDIIVVDSGKTLPYKSYSEINYKIFGLASEAYFLELYEYAKRKVAKFMGKKELDFAYHEFDLLMFYPYLDGLGLQQNYKDDRGNDVTPLTILRHILAHGKRKKYPIAKNEAVKYLVGFVGFIN